MKKILPSLYRGKGKVQNKNQNMTVLKSVEENVKNVVAYESSSNSKNVFSKIKDIFNSPIYVYKTDIIIEMNDGKSLKKTIIGRTNNSLITIDDELIDVSKISKIDFLR